MAEAEQFVWPTDARAWVQHKDAAEQHGERCGPWCNWCQHLDRAVPEGCQSKEGERVCKGMVRSAVFTHLVPCAGGQVKKKDIAGEAFMTEELLRSCATYVQNSAVFREHGGFGKRER